MIAMETPPYLTGIIFIGAPISDWYDSYRYSSMPDWSIYKGLPRPFFLVIYSSQYMTGLIDIGASIHAGTMAI
jgi:hypothetical protein